MNPTTRAVFGLLSNLELAQFTADADERERVQEVRKLAEAQIQDDVQDISRHRVRIGRNARVLYMGDDGAAYSSLWRKWTPDQMALEAGMLPFIQRLTPAQREAIELCVVRGLSEREGAKVLRITQQGVHDRIHKGVARLRKDLATAFLEPVAA